MFKDIVKVSVVTATLFFVGCGGDSSPSKESSSLPKVSSAETKTLAKSLAMQGVVTEQLSQSKNIAEGKSSRSLKQSRQEISQSCINGGTMTMKDNFDLSKLENMDLESFNPNDLNMTMTMSFNNCIEDGMTTNGTMQMETKTEGQKMIMTMKYLTDFEATDGAESFKILKDSIVKDEMVSETKSISTETITVLYGDEKYEAKDLKMAILMSENSFGFYPISGEEIVNGKSFRVDESYDASHTPMLMDDDGSMKKGGKSKYIDSKNNHITVEATAKDELTITVDTDGDGKADEKEVIKL